MRNMKEATGDLLSSAAPSVKAYLRLRTLWKDIMRIHKGRKVLDLSSLTEPLGIYTEELHVGAYSPAVASAIKRYEGEFLKTLKKYGFHVSSLKIKIVKQGRDNNIEGEEQTAHNKFVSFSDEEIEKASRLFSMIDDNDIKKRLAIIWLKSQRGGSACGRV
ncbi:hypothetical protein [Zhurongbacter thermophilus]